ncbi:MAG: hypothetical protein ABR898_08185 [Terracidiphilus sp.]|jgi:hypothetical protein
MPDSSSSPNKNPARIDGAIKWLLVGERETRWLRWVFVLAAALYFIFIGLAETGPVNEFGHDVIVLLDGGWRVLSGQIPYRDFYLALGPLEFMITAFGMLLTRGSTQGIAVGNAIFGITVGLWGWLLSRRRMPVVPALIVAAWLILTATSPTPLGLSSNVMSCAMIYNRHGYALLGIVLVECAFASERSRFGGGVSSGIALVLMAFLKLNYFGIAGLMLLATVPVRREEMARLWGFMAGFACTLAAFALFLRFAIPAFLFDMRLALAARSTRLTFSMLFGEIGKRGEIVPLAMVTAAVVLLTAQGRLWQRYTARVALLGGVVIASGLFFSQTNVNETGCQLATLWAILVVGLLAAAYPKSKEKIAVFAVTALCLGAIFFEFFGDAQNLRTLSRYRAPSVMAMGASVACCGMERLKFYDLGGDASDFSYDNGHLFVAIVDDGLALLEKSSTPEESVVTLGFEDPFAYALRRKPALGGSPWLRPGDNFPRTPMLDPEMVFGNADLTMLPNYPTSNGKSNRELAEAYGPYIAQHFTFVARSQWWSLYRRNR